MFIPTDEKCIRSERASQPHNTTDQHQSHLQTRPDAVIPNFPLNLSFSTYKFRNIYGHMREEQANRIYIHT